MKQFSGSIFLSALALSLLVLTGCGAKRVLVPPRIDLTAYRTIGMIELSSNAEGNLKQFASQKFVETLQSSQSGLRILELGGREQVLESVHRDQLDHESIRALGKKYNVDAIIIGHMDVTDVKPSVNLSTLFSKMSIAADVEATLTTRLYETESGVTAWTNSVTGKENVAHVGLNPGGPFSFGADDPESAYGKLVNGLVYTITRDFRARYVKQ